MLFIGLGEDKEVKMKTIKEFLNQIRWDKRKINKDYIIYYHDRIRDSSIPLKFIDVNTIEGNFMIIIKDDKEIYIPLHRVKYVLKKEHTVVWSR